MVTERIDERALSKLKWRCRRGLLENDLFIERFFARHEDQLTIGQAEALTRLMDLSDNDLLDVGKVVPQLSETMHITGVTTTRSAFTATQLEAYTRQSIYWIQTCRIPRR